MSDTERVWEVTWRERPPEEMPWEEGRPSAELVRLVESGRVMKGPALDICCGSAVNALYLAEQGFACHGLDIAPTALKLARERVVQSGLACRLVKGDAARLPYPDSTFALVFDRGCFHSIPPDDRDEYARGIRRVLRPGGKFLLLAFSGKPRKAAGAPWPFSAEAIRGHFEKWLEINEIRELPPAGPGGRRLLSALMSRPSGG
jgi:ubiquinone/menaquinone biosynthesis C-methylase UbiE